jgi:hypothetical protein
MPPVAPVIRTVWPISGRSAAAVFTVHLPVTLPGLLPRPAIA